VDTKVMVSLFYVLGGYKGYGLSMMVEIFCGIMSGGQFGPFIRQWKDFERPANLVSRKHLYMIMLHSGLIIEYYELFKWVNDCF
jgi:LDH2 family malate/lactate/ureidoglycolate dehydrogenase